MVRRREWHDDLDRAGGKGVRSLLGGWEPIASPDNNASAIKRAFMASCFQSTLMAVSFITFPQRSASLRMKAENCSGVLVTG